MRGWERTFLGATLLMVCAATSAKAVVSAEIVQQVDAVLADRTPIVYVAIPGDVARAGLSLVHVVVTNVTNPAAAPVRAASVRLPSRHPTSQGSPPEKKNASARAARHRD